VATIVNNFTFPVILADDRNADVSWAHHRARGSLGGVDMAYPYGSVVLANAAGTIKNLPNTGSGGNTVQLHMDDGRYIEYMHLSKFLKSTGDTVKLGDKIANSGASGFKQANYYAAHLHVHLYTPSTRVNLFHYFKTVVAPAAPPVVDDTGDQMAVLLRSTTGKDFYLVDEMSVTHTASQDLAVKWAAAYGTWVDAPSASIQALQQVANDNRTLLVNQIVAALKA